MQPVVPPSRSSHTRSVFARFRARISGNGIFDVTRLMAFAHPRAPPPWPERASRQGAGWRRQHAELAGTFGKPPSEKTPMTKKECLDPSAEAKATVERRTARIVRRALQKN